MSVSYKFSFRKSGGGILVGKVSTEERFNDQNVAKIEHIHNICCSVLIVVSTDQYLFV